MLYCTTDVYNEITPFSMFLSELAPMGERDRDTSTEIKCIYNSMQSYQKSKLETRFVLHDTVI